MKTKHWLALLYGGLLVGIVLLADGSRTHTIFNFIRALPFGDKIGHFCLMGGLSFVVNYALDARRNNLLGRSFLTGTLITLLIVTLEECTQIFVRYRTFDLKDLAFDYAGIIIFGQIAAFLARRRAQRQQPSAVSR